MKQRPENTCGGYLDACGDWKDQSADLCYNCYRRRSRDEGRVCDCGNFKKNRFPTCLQCKLDAQSRSG